MLGDISHMSADYYQELAGALRTRLAVIADHALRDRDATAHLEQLKAASEHLSTLAAALPPGSSPQLRHYLLRCSYDKALEHLESGLF